MAPTNHVYCWKDGDRMFVDVNGATIEAQSLTFDQHVATLRFRARMTLIKATRASGDEAAIATTGHSRTASDPLLDECLW